MRKLKLCVATLAVLGGGALAVAGQASATVLCKANESPTCVGPKTWPSGTNFELRREGSAPAKFTLGETQIDCKEATARMTIGTGTPLPVTITKVVWGSCTNSCTVTARNLPWLGKIESNGFGSGVLKLEQREGANPSVNITCQKLVCIYGSPNPEFVVAGGVAGFASLITVTPTKLALEEPNKFCESEVDWFGGYSFVVTESVYVV